MEWKRRMVRKTLGRVFQHPTCASGATEAMSIQPCTSETVSARSRTDHRPNYILIGIDTEGTHHVYRTTDETVHVISDSDRTHRYDLNTVDQRINDWIEYVKVERGFQSQHLYSSLTNSLFDAFEGDDQ